MISIPQKHSPAACNRELMPGKAPIWHVWCMLVWALICFGRTILPPGRSSFPPLDMLSVYAVEHVQQIPAKCPKKIGQQFSLQRSFVNTDAQMGAAIHGFADSFLCNALLSTPMRRWAQRSTGLLTVHFRLFGKCWTSEFDQRCVWGGGGGDGRSPSLPDKTGTD